MWEKIKSFFMGSTTIAWSYFLALAGFGLQFLDAIGDVVGNPTLPDIVHNAVGNPPLEGKILLGISFVNIICRLRSLRKMV